MGKFDGTPRALEVIGLSILKEAITFSYLKFPVMCDIYSCKLHFDVSNMLKDSQPCHCPKKKCPSIILYFLMVIRLYDY